jgi:hypothetical protein
LSGQKVTRKNTAIAGVEHTGVSGTKRRSE